MWWLKFYVGEPYCILGLANLFKPEVLSVNCTPPPTLFLPCLFSTSLAESRATRETKRQRLGFQLPIKAPVFKGPLQLKRLFLFCFCFGSVFAHLTTKQDPYFEAEVILNTQNIGSNFKTFKLTTDDPTLGKSVQTQSLRISYTLYVLALHLSIVYILQQ